MDPKAVQKIQAAFMLEMHRLEVEYVQFLMRMGCKRITLHRF
jgi:hypothetical protein